MPPPVPMNMNIQLLGATTPLFYKLNIKYITSSRNTT